MPPNDWTYRWSVSQTLSDPFGVSGAAMGALFFGVISFPVVYLVTKNGQLDKDAAFIFCIVEAVICAVTPFAGLWGLPAAVGALAISLFTAASRNKGRKAGKRILTER